MERETQRETNSNGGLQRVQNAAGDPCDDYIRVARSSDAAALCEIYAFYVVHSVASFDVEPPTVAEMEGRYRSIVDFYPYLVYCVRNKENDGNSPEISGGSEKIVGYAYARRGFARAAYAWFAETTLYVAPEFRGRGVGGALYRALIPLIRRQGVRNAFANITAENENSLEFHRKNGFSFVGTLKNAGYKAGRWLDVAFYERRIGELDANPEPPIPFSQLDPTWVADVCANAVAQDRRKG